MALTLNDWQEASLRQWWTDMNEARRRERTPDWARSIPSSWDTLADAITPLMKPWRMEPYELTFRVWSTDLRQDYATTGNRELAQRICDLLNESENRTP